MESYILQSRVHKETDTSRTFKIAFKEFRTTITELNMTRNVLFIPENDKILTIFDDFCTQDSP